MGLLEVLLLLAGIIICVISYRLPAKREEELEETKELAKEEIKELVNQELVHVREQVEGTVDETITYAVEKTERFMDRMANEKMTAISEYSDTVMEDIHKNHTEVLFLYDMLNDKHENVKNTAAKVNEAVKAVHKAVISEPEIEPESKVQKKAPVAKVKPVEKEPVAEPEAELTTEQVSKMDISFSNLGMENSNEEILKLHREGKSNVVIAKELGLGVGEVKLVIDLFEGK